MLQSVGYTEATSGKKVSELSLLDQRRVAIARALCCDAETVILDEPTKGLSESDAAELLELLRRIARSRDPQARGHHRHQRRCRGQCGPEGLRPDLD